MKKLGLAAITAGGLGAALLGLAGPATATTPAPADATTITTGVDHLDWLDKIQPKAQVPQVDNTVRHSGR